MAIFSLTDTGLGEIGNPMEFLCPGTETVMLEGLCDGSNDCPNGEDETNFLCESKLYPDSPSETWVFQRILLAEDNAYCTPVCPHWIYTCMYTRIIIAMHYILQTSVVSLTTEPVTSHENVILARLVKSAGIVCLSTQRTSLQQILAMILASVSDNNRLYAF